MDNVTLHPIGPTAFDALMAELKQISARVTRIETRQARHMLDGGIPLNKTFPDPRDLSTTDITMKTEYRY